MGKLWMLALEGRAVLVAGTGQVVVSELGRHMDFAGIESRCCRGWRMGMLVSAEVEWAADIRRAVDTKALGSRILNQVGEQRIGYLEDR